MRFKAKKGLSISLISLLLVVSFATYYSTRANAANLASSSVQLGDPRPSNPSTAYTVNWTFPSTSTIKCILVNFGNSATVTPPLTGMTTTGSSGSINGSTTGGLTPGNWTYSAATNGVFKFTYSTGEGSTATAIQLDITGVTNPSVGTFYSQISTFNNIDCSTSPVDSSNIMALVTTGGVATSVTVDPTLTFSVAGYSSAVIGAPAPDLISTTSSIAFGNVSAGGSATHAAQLLTTSTNASHGYNIYIRNNQLLTNANTDTIRAQGNSVGSSGAFDGSTSQSSFGFITDSSTISFSSNTFAGLTTSNVSIDTQTAPQNAAALHVEYKLQLKSVQPPGTYSNVITYTATPTY